MRNHEEYFIDEILFNNDETIVMCIKPRDQNLVMDKDVIVSTEPIPMVTMLSSREGTLIDHTEDPNPKRNLDIKYNNYNDCTYLFEDLVKNNYTEVLSKIRPNDTTLRKI